MQPVAADDVVAALTDIATVIADAHAPYYGTELDDRSLIPHGDARIGSTRFADWLRHSTAPSPAR
jgi:hypothetical protein